MTQQTAVKWLEDQLSEWIHYEYEKAYEQYQKVNGIFEQAKAMEKEQIINAYLQGCFDEELDHNKAEQYYNETYK